ncbi:MAG: hypothetical protein B7Y96_06940, partial [Comamonadaceae bacterium 32-67-11]
MQQQRVVQQGGGRAQHQLGLQRVEGQGRGRWGRCRCVWAGSAGRAGGSGGCAGRWCRPQQAQIDPASTGAQGRARGQHGSAGHAGAVRAGLLAADHHHAAVRALVWAVQALAGGRGGGSAEGRGPARVLGLHLLGAAAPMQPSARRWRLQAQGAPTQVVEPNLAAGLAAVVRKQAGLEGEQAQGVAQWAGAGRGLG